MISQKFIILCLIAFPEAVSLDAASYVLFGNHGKGTALVYHFICRTMFFIHVGKSRRLYDIANLLAVLQLIHRQQSDDIFGFHRSAFAYCGEPVKALVISNISTSGTVAASNLSQLIKRGSRQLWGIGLFFCRHFLFTLCMIPLVFSSEEKSIDGTTTTQQRSSAIAKFASFDQLCTAASITRTVELLNGDDEEKVDKGDEKVDAENVQSTSSGPVDLTMKSGGEAPASAAGSFGGATQLLTPTNLPVTGNNEGRHIFL